MTLNNKSECDHRRWISIFSAIACGVAVIFLVAAGVEKKDWSDNPYHGELIRNVTVLHYIDTGDIKLARDMLGEDSMLCAIQLLGAIKFTTDKNVLVEQPGLRAAAKYWGYKALPDTVLIRDAERSNAVYKALAIITDEMNRRQKEKEAMKKKE